MKADDPLDRDAVCTGATAALAFLGRHGIAPLADVEVEVVGELPGNLPFTVVGCCSGDGRHVYLLSYAEYAERQRYLFDLPPDRTFYAGVAAHEVAHAIIGPRFAVQPPSPTGMEYIAYVAMLASLPEPQRGALLALFPGQGLNPDDGTARHLHMVNPMLFGVEAYRHFQKQERPALFLGRVLSGAALAD